MLDGVMRCVGEMSVELLCDRAFPKIASLDAVAAAAIVDWLQVDDWTLKGWRVVSLVDGMRSWRAIGDHISLSRTELRVFPERHHRGLHLVTRRWGKTRGMTKGRRRPHAIRGHIPRRAGQERVLRRWLLHLAADGSGKQPQSG